MPTAQWKYAHKNFCLDRTGLLKFFFVVVVVFQWRSRIHCRLDLLLTLKLSVRLRFTNYLHLSMTETYVTAENKAARS